MVYAAIALNVAYAITFIFITVFQCSPVSFVSMGDAFTDLHLADLNPFQGMEQMGWRTTGEMCMLRFFQLMIYRN